MGCCLSTAEAPKAKNPDAVPPNNHSHLPESDASGRAPSSPPPPIEEETVKEVLSETPIPKPPSPTVIDHNKKQNQQQPEVHEIKIEPTVVMNPAEDIVSEVSEVSEMCSLSESFSKATVTDKTEDDGEVTQRVHRSPAKVPRKRPYTGDHAGGKERGVRSPARMSALSPENATQVMPRSVQSHTTRRNVGPLTGVRRDPGEASGRRSRSPVMRGEAGARRPARHKNPNLGTPCRSGSRSPARTVENGGKFEKPNDVVSPETGESLENPLVSLECFIFL